MRFLSGTALTLEVSQSLKGQRFDAAVAYWGNGAIDFIGIGEAVTGSRIICDAYSGACNPFELGKLLDLGIEVRDCPGLHAKVYLAGDILISGSANASANGLGREDLEIDLGLEAAIVTGDADAVGAAQSWFNRLVLLSTPVGHSDIERIRAVWLPRRNARPVLRSFKTVEEALSSGSSIFEDRRIFLVVYQPDPPPETVLNDYKASAFFDPATYDEDVTPFFWDAGEWDAQAGDLILSYEYDQGRLEFDDMCEVQAVLQNGMIIPVRQNLRPLGLSITKAQADRLGVRIGSLIANEEVVVPSGLFPFSNLAAILDKGRQPSGEAQDATTDWQALHLDLIGAEGVKEAYRHIISEFAGHDLKASPNSGYARAVRFHDNRKRYLFSFIVNGRHLLFYLRQPALRLLSRLREKALAELPKSQLNPGGEVTVRIEGAADAERLMGWLDTYLPLT